jgi:hypothetical protein
VVREPTARPAGPPPSSGTGTRGSLYAGILLVLAAFAVTHGPRVVHNLPKYHWEDFRHFHHNREQIHSLADCFTKPSAWPHGAEATYRPLSANLYYFAGRSLFGNRVEVYHAIDAVVHLINAVLLLLLCRELLPWPSSLVPPILFVSRLAHEQDIAYTSNFDTLSYAAFGLAGVLLFVRARRWERPRLEAVAVASFGLSLLCKEAAVVWPAILTVYGWLFDRAAWRRYVPAWLVAGGWAVAYPQVVRRMYPTDQPGFALDFRPGGLLERYGAYLLSFVNGLIPKVDPEQAGWAIPPGIPALAGTTPMLLLMAGLVIVTGVLLAWSRVRPASVGVPARVTAFGLAWFFVGTAPFAVLAERLFMRYSYVGHAGLAVALGGVTAAIAGPAWASLLRARRPAALLGRSGTHAPQ